MDTDMRNRITGTGPELEPRKAYIPTAIRNFEKISAFHHLLSSHSSADLFGLCVLTDIIILPDTMLLFLRIGKSGRIA